MKRFLLILLILLVAIGGYYVGYHSANVNTTPPIVEPVRAVNPDIRVSFSPNGGCTNAIVNEINSARKSIRVQAYSYTSDEIVKALIAAHKRGVNVEVIVDKSQVNGLGSKVKETTLAGIPVYIDSKHAIAHNKIIIIDDTTLITGSFNFTKNAEEKNAENLLIIKSEPKLIENYDTNYAQHKGHTGVY